MRAGKRRRGIPNGAGGGGRRGGAALLALPWVGSVALHSSLIGAGFVVVWSVAAPNTAPPPQRLEASFLDPSLARVDSGLEEVERAEDTQRESELSPLLEAEVPTPSVEEILASDAPASADDSSRATLSDAARQAMYERRVEEAEFFGSGSGAAVDIVYVVDGSGSMVSTFPFVLRELARSIGKLSPTQRFQVVFFHGDPESGRAEWTAAPTASESNDGGGPTMIRATRAAVAKALEWIEAVRPIGRSNPLPALEVALGLSPDAIFLLSNSITGAGEWEVSGSSILDRLEELNPMDKRNGARPVSIRTVQFLRPDPSGILRAIGAAHGGEDGYGYVSREDLER